MRVVDTITRSDRQTMLKTLRDVPDNDLDKSVADACKKHGISRVDLLAVLRREGHSGLEALRKSKVPETAEAPKAGRASASVLNGDVSEKPAQEDSSDPHAAGDTLLDVDISQLVDDPLNPRDLQDPTDREQARLDELCDSIQANGLLQKITVWRAPEGLMISMGHRRRRALEMLVEKGRTEYTRTQVVVRKKPMHTITRLATSLVENSHREGLDPIEEARAIKGLQVAMGNCTQVEVGERIGRPQTFISQRICLLTLSVEDQEMVRRGRLKIGAAVKRATQNAGVSRPREGVTRANHFSQAHPLADRVMRRCALLGHSVSPAKSVGGVGCGECWEEIIRVDERSSFSARMQLNGSCPVCDTPVDEIDPSQV